MSLSILFLLFFMRHPIKVNPPLPPSPITNPLRNHGTGNQPIQL
jgi:hypothetical protein